MRDWLHALQPLTEDERRAARVVGVHASAGWRSERALRGGEAVGVLVQGGVGKESAPKAAGELWRAVRNGRRPRRRPDELRRSGGARRRHGRRDAPRHPGRRALRPRRSTRSAAWTSRRRRRCPATCRSSCSARAGSAPTQTALAHAFFDQLNSI